MGGVTSHALIFDAPGRHEQVFGEHEMDLAYDFKVQSRYFSSK